MKKLLLLTLFCGISIARAQVLDDFSDKDFTSNPPWIGDTAKFKINSSEQLQLNAIGAGTAYLSTESKLMQSTIWEFFLRLSFAPSGNNYGRVYLASDNADLSASLNGYFIHIGETGSNDGIDLFRQDGTAITKIIDGPPGQAGKSSNNLRIKLVTDISGNWELYADTLGGSNLQLIGQVNDATYTQSSYFGVFANFTSSNATKFYWDDIVVKQFIKDTIPPLLTGTKVLNDTTIELTFSEPLDTSAGQVSNYLIDKNIGAPASVLLDGSLSKVTLTLSTPIVSLEEYELSINGIKDLEGNAAPQLTTMFSIFKPVYGDIIITEIMADPSPVVGVPETEYVELYNGSGRPIVLSGWTFSDNGRAATLSGITLQPDSFIVLYPIGPEDFSVYGKAAALSNWPALNNSEDEIFLKDEYGNIIHSVKYNSDWHTDNTKEEGGWSLEMIDRSIPCLQKGNWTSSTDVNGGTPCKLNSVNGSRQNSPKVSKLEFIDLYHLRVYFDKVIDSNLIENLSTYSLNGYGSPTSVSKEADNEQVVLSYSSALTTNTIYVLTVNSLSDCAGNMMAETKLEFIVPGQIDSFDVVVNEILFNPKPDGVDYVELYNQSDKMLDLSDLYIATVDAEGEIKTRYRLSTEQKIFYPDEYLVLTTNAERMAKDYWVRYPEKVLQVKTLPTFADDEGTVLLLKADSSVIDRVDYSEDWHFELIADEEGVSLEKIKFELPSNDPTSWHSAASTVGYGTPTYENSQLKAESEATAEVKLAYDILSPDNDGYQDVLAIQYNFEKPGMLARSAIYDIQGRLVKTLQNNEMLATSGTVYWDGITNTGSKAPIGAYIILFEAHHPEGDVKAYKMSCTVAERF